MDDARDLTLVRVGTIAKRWGGISTTTARRLLEAEGYKLYPIGLSSRLWGVRAEDYAEICRRMEHAADEARRGFGLATSRPL